ncbi:hepatic lectin-like isoform X2 [Electrophorus electricus]|uniref:hepatic lectin-like isoform X2 n=1 Tax=Electrophorus electricus TaxID=8005 RepID=UPI000F0A8FA7|nr:hepatic lectin-like isoform X2 [Electrophorus electricus]
MQQLCAGTQCDRQTADSSRVNTAHSEEDRHNRKVFIMLGVLSVFLLILTLTVGIKFSQVSKQMSEVTLSLQAVKDSVKAAQTGVLHPDALAPVRGPCEEDWTFYKGKCYLLSRLRKKWHDAEKACNQQRAHLLVVNNADELDYISQLVGLNENYWIGLVEKEDEGDWSWVDGTDFKSTEHFWDERQPDDWDVRVDGEDCGQLHAKHTLKRNMWNDADCTLSYKYICEGTPRH